MREEFKNGKVVRQDNGVVGKSSKEANLVEKVKHVPEHTVIGIVVGEEPQCYYVWTKDAFPGKDAIIKKIEGRSLKVSQWIRMHLTSEEFNLYFPTQTSPHTPIFNCTSYTDIKQPLHQTCVTRSGKSVLVKIRNFVETKYSGLFYHRDLGYIFDDRNILNGVSGQVEITVVRRYPKPFYGEMLVWYVKEVDRYGSSSSLGSNYRNGNISPNIPNVVNQMRNLNINNNTLTRTIVGIISARCNNVLFVWIKEAHPGQDVMIDIPNIDLNIADWVNIQITEHEYEVYLSRPAKEKLCLKHESINRIKKIKPVLVTTPNLFNNSIRVEIPRIHYSMDSPLRHVFLGYIKVSPLVLENGEFSIIVERRKPTDIIKTVWYLVSANKLTIKKPENIIPRVQPKNVAKDMKTLPESEICTGFITSIRVEDDGTRKYYCWLIDKHISTCIHSPNKELFQGDMFESKFKQVKKDKWNHINDSEMKRIDEKLDFVKQENSIIITIRAKITLGQEKPEIEHKMFGKIIDLWNRLPKCILYEDPIIMKMSIKQQKNEENRTTWFVHKAFP